MYGNVCTQQNSCLWLAGKCCKTAFALSAVNHKHQDDNCKESIPVSQLMILSWSSLLWKKKLNRMKIKQRVLKLFCSHVQVFIRQFINMELQTWLQQLREPLSILIKYITIINEILSLEIYNSLLSSLLYNVHISKPTVELKEDDYEILPSEIFNYKLLVVLSLAQHISKTTVEPKRGRLRDFTVRNLQL